MSGLYTAIGAAALSAAGSGANAYSQNQNMRKEDNQSAQSIVQQGQINAKAEQAVGNLNQSIAKSNPATATKDQTAAYLAAANAAPSTTPSVPGGSKRYTQAAAGAKSDISDYARQTAGNAAAVAAPQLQRIGEGNQIADTASQLGRFNDQSASEQGILKTQLAGDQANPWLSSLSQVLSGAGNGLSSYAGYKKGQGMGGGGYNITPLGAGSQSLDAYGS